jgi:hypothetical protein
MIELKPRTENHFHCPECRSAYPLIKEILIQSVCTTADCTCRSCGFQFYQTFPISHTIDNPLSIGKLNHRFYPDKYTQPWLFDSVLKSTVAMQKQLVSVSKIVYKEVKEVVILNTLDFLYGHVLLKLYNAMYHLDHQKELGLIIIIPKMFAWLIPKGCAEVWVVDLKLNELISGYQSIQTFISIEFKRFDKIYLSRAYSHPDTSGVNIARLTGVKPFDLKLYTKHKPIVTFVLREDRWWYSSRVDYWFYRICRKLRIKGNVILSARQNRLVKKTIAHIKERLTDAKFCVVGLGRTGTFNGSAWDERVTSVTNSAETTWCQLYARSHVVIGVHGSNMLLPTALAAGCVEILPQDRYGNMVQDISVRYDDRRQLFFYRFADQYSSPKSIAAKVIAMVGDYNMYYKNMCRNVYGHL